MCPVNWRWWKNLTSLLISSWTVSVATQPPRSCRKMVTTNTIREGGETTKNMTPGWVNGPTRHFTWKDHCPAVALCGLPLYSIYFGFCNWVYVDKGVLAFPCICVHVIYMFRYNHPWDVLEGGGGGYISIIYHVVNHCVAGHTIWN